MASGRTVATGKGTGNVDGLTLCKDREKWETNKGRIAIPVIPDIS